MLETGGLKKHISIACLGAACFCCSSCGTRSDVPVYESSALGIATESVSISDDSDTSDSLEISEIQKYEEEKIEAEMSFDEMPYGVGVFSWDHLPVVSDIRCMKENGITELYQYLRPEYSDEDITKFLDEMAEINIDVYILDGEPEWSYAENYQGMKNVLSRVR